MKSKRGHGEGRCPRLLVLGLVLTLVAVGCGQEASPVAETAGDGHDHEHGPAPQVEGQAHGTVPGEPAGESVANRTVKVNANDKLEFDPAKIEISVGEVVTFVVTNRGKTLHEFVLGDREYQAAHEMEMSAGDMEMSHDGNAVTLAPGDSKRITWRFTAPGEVLYGCHVPGHYQGGMVGRILVTR